MISMSYYYNTRYKLGKELEVAHGLLELNQAPTTNVVKLKQDIDVLNMKMKTLARAALGDPQIFSWKNAVRKIYESMSPRNQCKLTIGNTTQEKTCWICGFKFDNRYQPMLPACEHVLPIAQAIFFLGLYSTRDRLNDVDTGNIIFQLEYEWAHRGCNLVKGDRVLIREDIDLTHNTPVWKVDSSKVEELLTDIMTTKTIQLGTIQRQIAVDPTKWLENNKKSMGDRLQKVTDFISRPSDPGFGNLTVLAGWAAFVDPDNMNDSFLKTIHIDPEIVSEIRRNRMSVSMSKPPGTKRTFDEMNGKGRRKRKNKRTRKNGFKVYK